MEEKGLSMLVLLLLVRIFITPSQAVNYPLIPTTEVHALLELKDHITDSKGLLGEWDANNTQYICESWAGVTCSGAGDHISRIDLGGFKMPGSFIPPQLGNLTFLVTLNLSANDLCGVIPLQLSRCMSLEVLDLSHNNLIGRVPSSLSSLSSLQSLNLSYNSLNGSIPMELGALSSLLKLFLRQNNLRGVIPSSLTNCTSLEGLDLGDNQLSGQIPMEIGALGNLTILSLFKNKLTGVIPPSLGNCTKLLVIALYNNQLIGPVANYVLGWQLLQLLYLHNNSLTGPLPSSLSKCKNLQNLDLSDNYFSGSIPEEFGALSSLEVLYMWGNNFIGAIPSTLSNCTLLVALELEINQLIGPIPAELGLLSYLQVLKLWENRLTGAIPSSLGNCTQLEELELSSNQLSGFIPPEITMLSHMRELLLYNNQLLGFKSPNFSNFTSLVWLELESNKMTDNILPQLGALRQLHSLSLGENQLSGQISWEVLTNCSSLLSLDLSHNHFSGRIEDSLGELQKLEYLLLQGNSLEGRIPNFWGFPQFMSLLEVDLSFNLLHGPPPENLLGQVQVSIDLSHNNFSGNLPSWMGKLVMVQAMSFSNNNFFGNIPESLGDCLDLAYLDLSYNNLSGDIPISLGNLTASLQTLDLSNNQLTGVLPSFLQHLHHLQFLNVSNNNLNGKIPNVGVFKHLNASCFQGNSGLCGPVIQKKCMDPFEKQPHRNTHLNWKAILFIALASLTVGTLLLVVALWYIYSRCHKTLPAINPKFHLLASVEKYTAEELVEATQGYSEENILGEGALAIVYKAIFSDGKVAAIKKFKDVSSSRQALLEEAQILCRLRHRNLVRVFGCVLNLDVSALVLDFMPNGSLENYMHQDECEPQTLSWEIVMKTATGVANGLTYLHHEYGVPIIHGDVKPSNILLDLDLEAHLADFGLAKLVKGEAISLSSNFKGSVGYMAPEYGNAARITTKVDVYSFGVVVLEMLTGKRATQLIEGISLHQWVKSKLIHSELTQCDQLLRPSLLHSLSGRDTSSNVPDKEMALQLLKMGVACTEEHPRTRPAMQKISCFFIDRKRRLI